MVKCNVKNCKYKYQIIGKRRCGRVFCAFHRYSDRHHCDFDFKDYERDKSAEENQKVVAEKIIKT